MRFSRFIKVFSVVSCLTLASVSAWAISQAPAAKDLQGLLGEEAVVSVVSQDQVTIKALKGESREITLTMNNASSFKVGEKVSVQGNTVKKLDAVSSNKAKPEPGIHPGTVDAK